MGHYSKNLGPLADEVVTECEFVSLDQKRRVKAVRTMWDTGSNATILSTALGLIPFLTDGPDEVFWYAFALGTIGGLAFSLVALVFFLPAWMPGHSRNAK